MTDSDGLAVGDTVVYGLEPCPRCDSDTTEIEDANPDVVRCMDCGNRWRYGEEYIVSKCRIKLTEDLSD